MDGGYQRGLPAGTQQVHRPAPDCRDGGEGGRGNICYHRIWSALF